MVWLEIAINDCTAVVVVIVVVVVVVVTGYFMIDLTLDPLLTVIE